MQAEVLHCLGKSSQHYNSSAVKLLVLISTCEVRVPNGLRCLRSIKTALLRMSAMQNAINGHEDISVG